MTTFWKLASAAVFAAVCPAFAGLIGVTLDDGNLYTVSTVNASSTLIGNTGVTNWADIQFAPNGTLYGFTTSAGTPSLYTINPTTASTTLVGPLNAGFVFEGGLAFSPGGIAYATNLGSSSAAQLFTINLNTGAATAVGTISGGSHDINGLAYRVADGKLIGLDRVTNSLLVIDPTTAAASTLAAVSATVGAVGGMTVLNGVGYFNTSGPSGASPGSNELYSFNLSTGAATLVGSLAPTIGGDGISGLAGTVTTSGAPEPASLALLCAGIAFFASLSGRLSRKA
jgi:hypothetical protein